MRCAPRVVTSARGTAKNNMYGNKDKAIAQYWKEERSLNDYFDHYDEIEFRERKDAEMTESDWEELETANVF